MINFVTRYVALVFVTVMLFGNFVACGSKSYKADLSGDSIISSNLDSSDPDSEFYGIHAPSGWVQLPIRFQVGSDLTEIQEEQLVKAMRTWEKAVGKELFEYDGVDSTRGDDFEKLYTSLNDSVNGHYVNYSWDKTGKPMQVLATTIWETSPTNQQAIQKSDIRFNGEHYIIGDALTIMSDDDRVVVDMESLALHELGHLLGLAHVDEAIDPYSIMNPTLYIGEGLTSRDITKQDVERIQKIYGCSGNACDLDALVAELQDSY